MSHLRKTIFLVAAITAPMTYLVIETAGGKWI